MEEITKAAFLAGYENGNIFDVILINGKIYGKAPTSPSNLPSSQRPKYKVVWADVP